jgi:hypothetical protein
MGDDELERAARKRRESVLAGEAQRQRDAEREAERATSGVQEARAEELHEALAGTIGNVAGYIAMGVCLVGPAALMLLLTQGHDPSFLVIGATVIGALVLMFVALYGTRRVFAALRLRALTRYEDRLVLAPYLNQLAEDWLDPRVEMRVEFMRPWDDAARAAAPDAIAEWMAAQLDRVTWEASSLHITTLPISTSAPLFAGLGASRTTGMERSNRAVHDCVHRFAVRVLPRLDARVPIKTIALSIVGATHRRH